MNARLASSLRPLIVTVGLVALATSTLGCPPDNHGHEHGDHDHDGGDHEHHDHDGGDHEH
jgi:hypothetical protein